MITYFIHIFFQTLHHLFLNLYFLLPSSWKSKYLALHFPRFSYRQSLFHKLDTARLSCVPLPGIPSYTTYPGVTVTTLNQHADWLHIRGQICNLFFNCFCSGILWKPDAAGKYQSRGAVMRLLVESLLQ